MAMKRRRRHRPDRPWCPRCRSTGFVDGPKVERNGRIYNAMIRCPDCVEKPPMQLERGQQPLDWAQRAAGERPE